MNDPNSKMSGSCCSPQSACCGQEGSTVKTEKLSGKRMDIEFMFIDLSVCTRCQGTETSLEEAITEVARVLELTGIETVVHKIHVQSEEQARELGFISSPTIRINGRDIQLDVKEDLCESCGDLCGEDVDCRVWVYQGKEYTVPPKAMIIEAVLKEVYGATQEAATLPPRATEVPDNLKRFFATKQKQEAGELNITEISSCCGNSGSGKCC